MKLKTLLWARIYFVSRSHPNFLKRLFEMEVPEIYDGVVEIKSIAREAGTRSKISVYSQDDKIDPVGACVGPRGLRVQNIVSELNGEKSISSNTIETPRDSLPIPLAL